MTDLDTIIGALGGGGLVGVATRWGPTVARRLASFVARDAANVLTRAQANEANTRAEHTAVETLRAVAAELRETHRQDRAEDARRCDEARARDRADLEAVRARDRRECLEREAQLQGQVRELAQRVTRIARRVAPGSDPDMAPVPDASITPIAGVRVDQDPTPDLHTSATPTPTDPPGPRRR
jgi:hypothetical protein